jgi:hypothetical protein
MVIRVGWLVGWALFVPIVPVLLKLLEVRPNHEEIKGGQRPQERDIREPQSGIELTSGLSLRRFRVLFDFYNGFNPFGQFYDHRIRAAGIEVNFGF